MEKKTGKPELEDGFIRIATELFEALIAIRIPGEPRQVFDFILRKTYGYQKTVDSISLTQISLATKIGKSNTARALRKLLNMRLVVMVDNNPLSNMTTKTRKYKINKYYSQWQPLSRKTTAGQGVVNNDDKKVSNMTTTKDIKDKDKRKDGAASENEELLRLRDYFSLLSKKTTEPEPLKYPTDSNEIQLAVFLIETIRKSPLWTFKPRLPVMSEILESTTSNNQTKQLQSWAHYFHLLLSVDKRTVNEIKELIKISQSDGFWYRNIRSPKSLRKHWDLLQVVAHEALAKVRTGSKKVPILRICSACGHEWDKNAWNSLECLGCGHYNQQYEYKPDHLEPAGGGAHLEDRDQARLDALVEQATPGQPQPPLTLLQGEKDHA